MGVRGLTTYVKANGRKFLKEHKLHNCYLIIDGYSIATNLFIYLHSETAFGGNYDAYAWTIKDFFRVLKKCQIKPLVVFDGGYERRKLRTVYQRMRNKIATAKHVNVNDSTPNFPLFMRHIFREVLVELKIPFAQCDFEADVEIATLARELNCPILSYDSDFYIFDVMYIPFPTLSLEALPMTEINQDQKYYLKCKLYEIDNFLDSFGGLDRSMLPLLAAVLGNDYISRSVFKSFFEQFKVSKSKKKNTSQVRIAALLEWLRKESLETALRKILGRMKQKRRRLVAFRVKSIMMGYTKYFSIMNSYLSIQTVRKEVDVFDIDQIINQLESTTEEETEEAHYDSDCEGSEEEIDECEKDKEEDSDFDDLDISDTLSEHINTNSENEDFEIPNWFVDFMRKGYIHSSIMDILTMRIYFCPIQVEDYNLPHSHRLSLPILSVIVGLLLGHEQRIRYWARNLNGKLEWFSLDSVAKTKTVNFPRLQLLNRVPLSEKRLILLETLDLDVDVDLFPKNWQLFVIAVLFWLKNMSEPVATVSHLHTLVMCIMSLQVVSSKIGCYQTRKDFMRKYSKQLKKLNSKDDSNLLKTKQNKESSTNSNTDIVETNNSVSECVTNKENITNSNTDIVETNNSVSECVTNKENITNSNTDIVETNNSVSECVTNKENITNSNTDIVETNNSVSECVTNKESKILINSKQSSITELLNSVTKEDCIVMYDTLSSFYRVNKQLIVKPKLFCITSVHSFAIFQSCLHHIMLLNSVLGFPLTQCFVSKFYSGLFAYNVFTEVSTKKNVHMYVHTILKNSPSLLSLYDSILNAFLSMLPPEHLAFNLIKNKRKKKKVKSKVDLTCEIVANTSKETGDEDIFLDENNKFSLLAIS